MGGLGVRFSKFSHLSPRFRDLIIQYLRNLRERDCSLSKNNHNIAVKIIKKEEETKMKKKRLIGCGLGAILLCLGIVPPILGNFQPWDILVAMVGAGLIGAALIWKMKKSYLLIIAVIIVAMASGAMGGEKEYPFGISGTRLRSLERGTWVEQLEMLAFSFRDKADNIWLVNFEEGNLYKSSVDKNGQKLYQVLLLDRTMVKYIGDFVGLPKDGVRKDVRKTWLQIKSWLKKELGPKEYNVLIPQVEKGLAVRQK